VRLESGEGIELLLPMAPRVHSGLVEEVAG
jgi:hypothetical protein